LMLQQESPEDFVLATGETHSVRQFLQLAFNEIGKELVWEGEGSDEIGKDKETGNVLIKVNPKFYRPSEVELLLGDASKAERVLGWRPKTAFVDLVKEMVAADIELMKKNPNA